MSALPTDTHNVELLRQKIIVSIALGDLPAMKAAEEELTRQLVAAWKPGQATPAYNQHLLFARGTRLNARFAELCAVIHGRGDAETIPAIRNYLAACPLDLAAATQFILRLSRLGLVSQPAMDQDIAIPRQFVFFWDDPKRPLAVDRLIDSWRSLHPDFEILVFDDRTAAEWLAAHCGSRHERAFRRCQHAAMKADLFRLCFLFQSGGIYVDCDDRCRQPIDHWLKGRDLVLYQESHLSFAVANNFMAAAPRLQVFRDAIGQALDSLEAPSPAFTFSLTGPGLLTVRMAQWLLRPEARDLHRLRLLSAVEYLGKVSPHLQLPYKGTDQHWLKKEGAGA
jgi:hypothetical protein